MFADLYVFQQNILIIFIYLFLLSKATVRRYIRSSQSHHYHPSHSIEGTLGANSFFARRARGGTTLVLFFLWPMPPMIRQIKTLFSISVMSQSCSLLLHNGNALIYCTENVTIELIF